METHDSKFVIRLLRLFTAPSDGGGVAFALVGDALVDAPRILLVEDAARVERRTLPARPPAAALEAMTLDALHQSSEPGMSSVIVPWQVDIGLPHDQLEVWEAMER